MKLPRNFQFDFQRKRVLVTGAGKGIGREIARMLHSFNARVVALSRTESDLPIDRWGSHVERSHTSDRWRVSIYLGSGIFEESAHEKPD
jgi:NAD(P)-dependent dehydrogenase (short-subunit alcohol dehydrogenase family)